MDITVGQSMVIDHLPAFGDEPAAQLGSLDEGDGVADAQRK